jgi:hypothetical protein
VEVLLAAPALSRDSETALVVRIDHGPGTFVFGEPIPPGYVAATVTVRPAPGLTAGAPKYPPSKPFAVEGIDDVFYVLEGDVAEIAVPLRVSGPDRGPLPVNVEVRYQACDQQRCHLPHAVTLELVLPVS